MNYSPYILRRSLLADRNLDHDAMHVGLIFAEYVDWKTGTKTFAHKQHLNNWMAWLVEVHRINITKKSQDDLIDHGYLTLRSIDDQQIQLQLISPTI